MTSANDEQVNRRDLASVLGLAVGAFALSKCTVQNDGPIASTHAALKGTNPVWFDTIVGASASLRTTIGDSVNQAAIVEGYSVAGDGGGGVFWWDATSGTDDGGTVIVPGATGPGAAGPCWRRIYDGAFQVRWFGAKGDGSTNDDAAFQNALASLGSTPPPPTAVLEVASGTYVLTQTVVLPGNVWLRGMNMTSTVLSFSCVQSTSRPWGDGILCEGGQQRISDLSIVNHNASNTSGRGIDLTATIGGPAIVERCTLDGWQEQLVFDGYECSLCRDCYFGCDTGVGSNASNVHIRFAAPHGRNNVTGQNTNVIKVDNCNFFPNGGVFLWHQDGITHTCDFLNFETGTEVACVKCSGAVGVHYSHCESEGSNPIFMVDAPGTVGVQNLKITDCQMTIPSNAPLFWVTANTSAWAVYIRNNEFFGAGSSAGVFKLDGYVLNNYELGPNFIPYATTIFVGAPYDGSGYVYQAGRLGLGTMNQSQSALEIQEQLAAGAPSGRAVLSKNGTAEQWWIGTSGRSTQWKRATTGFNFDMPNGETVYQEYFVLNAGAAPVTPFSSATDYPLLSGLHASDDLMHVYEMEAIAHGYNGARYYHRKQRLAIVQYASTPVPIPGLSGYPDEFEKTSGSGWPTATANIAISPGGQIAVTVQSNSADGMRWYIKIRIVSRANY